jgi:hypothetical protein
MIKKKGAGLGSFQSAEDFRKSYGNLSMSPGSVFIRSL